MNELPEAKDWKKYDTTSATYKRQTFIALAICAALGAIGGMTLGYKISSAEEAYRSATPAQLQAAKEAAAKRKIRLRNRGK